MHQTCTEGHLVQELQAQCFLEASRCLQDASQHCSAAGCGLCCLSEHVSLLKGDGNAVGIPKKLTTENWLSNSSSSLSVSSSQTS